jgi:histidyl-tRNA synthetase
MKYQAVRGMNDILPKDTPKWAYLEKVLRQFASLYHFQEIRFPVLEETELFKRSVGESTDIVEKEMFSFVDREKNTDKPGASLSLRPEGTAPCIRAGIEHGLWHNQFQKVWYMGQMFRHERPQKGRYRQFAQFGVEMVNFATPESDVELIAFTAALWRRLGLTDVVTLEINTLGHIDERTLYQKALVDYFKQHLDQLDVDSVKRLEKNPLRILDSKNPDMLAVISDAPLFQAYLSETSLAHYARVKSLLEALNIAYVENPRLVRGLDYYCDTVFEWTTDKLGAQATICAGGRYNGLVQMLGGKQPTPAIGFAMGLERILLLLDDLNLFPELHTTPDAMFLLFGDAAMSKGLQLAEDLRQARPDLKIAVNTLGGSFKNQFKRAETAGAAMALVMGDEEIEKETVTVKYLKTKTDSKEVAMADLASCFA